MKEGKKNMMASAKNRKPSQWVPEKNKSFFRGQRRKTIEGRGFK